MRVVLDANVFLSALLTAEGRSSRVVDAWLDGRFTLLSHALLMQELRVVTRRDSIRVLIAPASAGRLVNQIAAEAVMVRRLPRVRRSSDPGDDFLLALCEAGHADYLVTGDKAGLLDLKRHERTKIITVRRFSAILNLR